MRKFSICQSAMGRSPNNVSWPFFLSDQQKWSSSLGFAIFIQIAATAKWQEVIYILQKRLGRSRRARPPWHSSPPPPAASLAASVASAPMAYLEEKKQECPRTWWRPSPPSARRRTSSSRRGSRGSGRASQRGTWPRRSPRSVTRTSRSITTIPFISR
jgi:hypothetical protein